ncbi:MAG: hypothetical protein FWC80_01870 [Firmicutes bacterium]|nr:hypothetical protein [Bacillota bacterium]
MDKCTNKDDTSILLGKFDSVDALLEAYGNLEREFTRKSQRLAELEDNKGKMAKEDNASLDNCDEVAERSDEGNRETVEAQPKEEKEQDEMRTAASRNESEALGDSPSIPNNSPAQNQVEDLTGEQREATGTDTPQDLSEDMLLELALSTDSIRDKIIDDYLHSLAANNGVRILSGRIGAMPLTPLERPKTLREAKVVADKLLRR